jgi:hypothetical protein
MRSELRRASRLHRLQWAVIAKCIVLFPLVGLSVRRRGFSRTVTVLERRSQRRPDPTAASAVPLMVEAVQIAARRRVLRSRCLVQSMVLWFLLRRRGVDASLVIGAPPTMVNGDAAHAWVELGGSPVNDTPDVRDRFPAFDLRLSPLTSAA